jgi:hypothetical protein
VVSLHSGTPLGVGTRHGHFGPRDTPRPGFGGSHHLPPYSILCATFRGLHPNGSFSRDSQVGVPKLSQNCPGWSPGTLGAHNSRLPGLIATTSKPKLYSSSRSFQRHVALFIRRSGKCRFPTFSGRESNCQFDSRPFFCPQLGRHMSKWPMRGHFRYLRFKTFPMTPRTPQCEVFWAFLSNPKHSGVPEDSKSPTLGVLGFTPTLGQSGVVT